MNVVFDSRGLGTRRLAASKREVLHEDLVELKGRGLYDRLVKRFASMEATRGKRPKRTNADWPAQIWAGKSGELSWQAQHL